MFNDSFDAAVSHQSHTLPQLKQTICYQLTDRARREIILHLCLLTTYKASGDRRLKHTHNVKVTKLSTGSNTRARIPQSLETFKRKLLLQEKIFATCRRSADTWTQITAQQWVRDWVGVWWCTEIKHEEEFHVDLFAWDRLLEWFCCLCWYASKSQGTCFANWQYRCLPWHHTPTPCECTLPEYVSELILIHYQ